MSHGRGVDLAAAVEAVRRCGTALGTGSAPVPIGAVVGRTLAADAHAAVALPSFDSAAMDGWVVAGPPPWRLGPGVMAGDEPAAGVLPPGCARPVACGAPVPGGADAVLRAEHGVVEGTLLTATRPVGPGAHIRRAGLECAAGERLLPAGTRLTSAAVALLAATGLDEVRVALPVPAEALVIGDEVRPSGVPRPGLVRDAMGPVLPGLLERHGAASLPAVHLGDDAAALADRIRASRATLVVTTGGTAHGRRDPVRAALGELGADLLVNGVDMRPGHPVLVARLPGNRVLLALPGNPLAAVAALAAIGVPLLDALSGRPAAPPSAERLADAVEPHPAGVRLLACARTPGGLAPVPHQRPHMLRGLATADVFALVPASGAAAGSPVPVLPLP